MRGNSLDVTGVACFSCSAGLRLAGWRRRPLWKRRNIFSVETTVLVGHKREALMEQTEMDRHNSRRRTASRLTHLSGGTWQFWNLVAVLLLWLAQKSLQCQSPEELHSSHMTCIMIKSQNKIKNNNTKFKKYMFLPKLLTNEKLWTKN